MHGIPVSQGTVKHILLHRCMCIASILNLFSCYSLQTLVLFILRMIVHRVKRGTQFQKQELNNKKLP
jgi:hypothetical protein